MNNLLLILLFSYHIHNNCKEILLNSNKKIIIIFENYVKKILKINKYGTFLWECKKKKPKENKGKKEKEKRKGPDPASFIISLIKGFSTCHWSHIWKYFYTHQSSNLWTRQLYLHELAQL